MKKIPSFSNSNSVTSASPVSDLLAPFSIILLTPVLFEQSFRSKFILINHLLTVHKYLILDRVQIRDYESSTFCFGLIIFL